MSTQLILYPQNFKGRYNSTSFASTQQFIVNGINFVGLNSTTSYYTIDGYPAQDSIINSPPLIVGNWYRYATTSGGPWGIVPVPTVLGNNVILLYNATVGHTGFYQQLSGLAVGGLYDVVINILIPSPVGGIVTVEVYSGTVLTHNQSFGTNATQITTTFTAQSTNPTFLIDYESTTNTLELVDISIQGSPEDTPNLIYTDLQDGQVICDLYQEEDIPLSLSIDDFKNVAEQVKSYSKDFNLPATKRNNRIFNNMFEITRANDRLIFNPYIKTQCVLKEDGFILFEGYLRLIDVKDKEGEISYNVNLYSDVLALADILKDKTFAELDFTELEHNYNRTTITNSWYDGVGLPLLNTPLPNSSFAYDSSLASPSTHTNVLKYPFIDWTHQHLVGGSGSGASATAGNPELTTLEQAFRPCIQLKYLINKIFAAAGFNWTSTFFDSADFGKLFMDFNWGSGNSPVNFGTQGEKHQINTDADNYAPTGGAYANLLFPHDVAPFIWSDDAGLDSATGVFTAPQDNTTYQISSTFGLYWTLDATVEIEWVANGVSQGITSYTKTSGEWVWDNDFVNVILQSGETLYCRFTASAGSAVKQNNLSSFGIGAVVLGNVSSSVFTTATLLQNLRGELGQWDFLKGIMTMFNLVSLVDENDPNNILIEPYSDVFINNTNSGTTGNLTLAGRGVEHDWTDKVDVSQMELKPLTDLNKETIFKFVEDDDDYMFNNYKNTSGHLYGSKKYDASGFTILEGEEEIIAEPFAATVSKPLMFQFPDFVVPSIYSMTDEGESEGFENSPRIFYNNGIKDTGVDYYIPAQNGVVSASPTLFLQFSHLTDIPTVTTTPPSALDSRDFVFGVQQLVIPLCSSPADNLFSLYWQPYFNELYNADTRTMTLKVNLSPSDVANFKFYDTVFIKNRTFRVNKIDYKPNDLATVEFILIP
jgi:hypothetical protein